VTVDRLGAFCTDRPVSIPGAPDGPLAGLRFAVKDVFDIAGRTYAAGSPDWLRTHAPADTTAPAVTRLLQAGASLVGMTQTDELTYSLNGENAHYGTPVNSRAPGRIPGGSSSGSAAAVAGGRADFALGTDCAGSVRLPASLCGVFGMRPSHGRVSADGVLKLAPSIDAIGWFADDGAVLERVTEVLLGESGPPAAPTRLRVAVDAFELAGAAVSDALAPVVDRLAGWIADRADVDLGDGALPSWVDVFRVVQGAEVWALHADWVERTRPSFGPGIAERFAAASRLEPAAIEQARTRRIAIAQRLVALLPEGTVLCLPSAPGIAPLLRSPAEAVDRFRMRSIALLCGAGLAGLPQLSVPAGVLDGCPVGLSLVAGRGGDRTLVALGRRLAAALAA